MRPSPSPGAGPSEDRTTFPTTHKDSEPSDEHSIVASTVEHIKTQLFGDQTRKIARLEEELHAEKQKTSELEKELNAEKKKTKQEETNWRDKYEHLVKRREQAKASLNNFMRDESESH